MAVGQEAVVADAMEAVRQRVKQEPTDELVCREGHDLRAAVMAVVLPAESHMIVRNADQAGVGNRDTMGVAAEIGQHLLRTAEGGLGVDDPLDAPQFVELAGEGGGFGKIRELPEEAELAGRERRVEFGKEQPAEESGEHAHLPVVLSADEVVPQHGASAKTSSRQPLPIQMNSAFGSFGVGLAEVPA